MRETTSSESAADKTLTLLWSIASVRPPGIRRRIICCTDPRVPLAGGAQARHVPAVRERRARVPRQRPGQARDGRPRPPPRHQLQVRVTPAALTPPPGGDPAAGRGEAHRDPPCVRPRRAPSCGPDPDPAPGCRIRRAPRHFPRIFLVLLGIFSSSFGSPTCVMHGVIAWAGGR